MNTFNTFKDMTDSYAKIVTKIFDNTLLTSTIRYINQRISKTVDICGVTKVSNDLLSVVITNSTLRQKVFSQFFDETRIMDNNSCLRKLFSYIFKTASKKYVEIFQQFFEEYICKIEIKTIFRTISKFSLFYFYNESNSLDMVNNIVNSFEKAQFISSFEMSNTNISHLSTERAWYKEVSIASHDDVLKIAIIFSVSINYLLDCSSDNSTPKKRTELLNRILHVLKV